MSVKAPRLRNLQSDSLLNSKKESAGSFLEEGKIDESESLALRNSLWLSPLNDI